MTCAIIPPYLLQRLASLDDPAMAPVAAAARASLQRDQPFRGVREGEPTPRAGDAAQRLLTARVAQDADRTIFDAAGTETLPGTAVRGEGDPAVTDIAVNEAYDGLGHTHSLYREVYKRASIDNRNLPLNATVHYGEEYDNAFWDGDRMVFGDGDGIVFRRMTASLSVIGHELTHGVTQYSANLEYQGQSGALNESVSDVFGALVEQRLAGQSAEEASWLIGLGLFTDAVEGEALRSMKAPGTAYNDDILGKDPQPADMSGYVDTRDDNGGVHLNSGIPNRAFYLAAIAIGGNAWEKAGMIWYTTLTSGSLAPTTNFADFALATVAAATELFGGDSPESRAVTSAWDGVGISPWDNTVVSNGTNG
ncbi:MAG: peptidase family protein [Glaciihabitans sp.]|nr:peptidase family protein [Glaciihabitans sp.]